MKLLFLVPLSIASSLWLTSDQLGQREFRRGEFGEAAKLFRDPMWQGSALYRDGEFEKAALAFGRVDTAPAHFNRGNAQVMRGWYKAAIQSYDAALLQRPDWKEAVENRALAGARAKLVEQKGGDLGDQEIGADKIVFDKDKTSAGQETEVTGGEALSDQQLQALWLRRVQTKPADFLRAKFAHQHSARSAEVGR